ncbi:MAG: hypothetical protein EXR99_10450 [Gemmataceae bacterium]|nr:hypothetical protein [Gemmataceae bacterium]
MEPSFPPAIIVRHRKENPKKCSVIPLKGRPGIEFLNYPLQDKFSREGYIRLAADGPHLSTADVHLGILLLDGSWRWAGAMEKDFSHVPPRSLSGFQTAYPRVSKLGTDPDNGLASIEALYIALRTLSRPLEGILDNYRWKAEFLYKNGW